LPLDEVLMRYLLRAALLLAALFGLYLTSLHGYLLFHGLAEGFSIVIACGIFMIVWNARRLLQNQYLLFIGIGYLFVGGIDFLHTLAYKGMGVFEGYGADLPTQLWIAGRYMEALSLLLATFFIHRKFSPPRVFIAYGLATGVLLASIFSWKIFPTCFQEGVGLTPFKIYSEYIICLILLAAVVPLIKNAKDFDRKVLILLIASIVTTIAQEIAFTAYLSVYGPSNLIGHLLKIISFYLLYKAIVETSLVSPWNLLFRDLKLSEAKFRSIFETNVVPIAYCNIDGQVLDANDDYLKLVGYTREELEAGKARWDVVTPPEWKHVDDVALERLGRDGASAPLEKEYLRRDGTRVPVLLGACRLPGDPHQVVAFCVDLTERKRAEDALKQSREELEQRVRERTAELERRNQELQNFTFVASHDLQEPLRKLQTFGDFIATRCANSISEQGRDYLRRMGETAGRMEALLRSLLDYSRMTSKDEPFAKVKLKEIVGAAVSDLETQIEEANASVEIGDLPEVEADAAQMASLFQNLIGNALKFRRDGEPPRVRIQCNPVCGNGSKTEEWEIQVEDNGIGFEEQYKDLMFKPFQRLHGRKKYGGVGMGLAICKKVVERHGGSITARSTPGHGSTFVVRLPEKQ
jgi:PAS domain S-box-containing protein